ncbi:MAG: bacillithiol biosynthesis deacetylase BshB1 [Balneolaceae bacterium]
METDILVFGAHPDDTELCCGGTIAKLVRQGRNIGVVDLTRGEMGTRGTPETRMKEAELAAGILGLSSRDNLGFPDSRIENSRACQLPVIERVRFYKPHICIIGPPHDRHPDHGDASRLLTDALFYSGLRKIETRGPEGRLQLPHRPAHILHYMQDQPFEPDFIFDITETLTIKEKAVRAFATQFNVEDPGKEPETYISGREFFEGIRARARHYGHLGGVLYGEPFKYMQKPFPVTSFDLFDQTSPVR